MSKISAKNGSYRIGAVARLTGIALPTLRIWERRYQVVQPLRSPKGGRLYSQADITRLSLLKAAVNAGHAISTVADLPEAELAERGVAVAGGAAAQRWRYAVAGPHLPGQFLALARGSGLELVRGAETTAALTKRLRAGEADVIVLEYSGMMLDQVREVLALIQQQRPKLVVLTYEFASARILRTLEAATVLALRGPLEASLLVRLATGLAGGGVRQESPAVQLPPPRFDSAQLERIGRMASSIRCECPQHLARLISSLAGFERYSAQCESLDDHDRALHQLLGKVSGQCRMQLENALQRVLNAEGLTVHID